ncbi:MAG: hypothetical protein ACWGQW_01125 [bacterium]
MTITNLGTASNKSGTNVTLSVSASAGDWILVLAAGDAYSHRVYCPDGLFADIASVSNSGNVETRAYLRKLNSALSTQDITLDVISASSTANVMTVYKITDLYGTSSFPAYTSTVDTINLYSGSTTRVANAIWLAPCTITRTDFYITAHTGSPTGTVYARIRDASDDSIVGTLESVDATDARFDLTGFCQFTGSVTISTAGYYYITFEFAGGDSSNYMTVHSDGDPGHWGTYYTYSGSWSTDLTHTLAMQNVTGALIINPVDKTDTATGSGTTAGTSTGTGTLSQADEIGVGIIAMEEQTDEKGTWTNSTSYVYDATYEQEVGTSGAAGHSNISIFTSLEVLSATTAQNVEQTSTGDNDWAAIVTTLKLSTGYADLVAGSGSFSLTGTAATLTHGYNLTAAAGSMSLSGTASTLTHGYHLTADPKTFSLSGTDTVLSADRLLTADPNAFTFTGTDAGLAHGYILAADPGTFTFTGQSLNLVVSRALSLSPGSFSITGTDVTLSVARQLVAGTGSFTLSGTAATLLVSRVLGVDPGSLTFTGTDVALTYSGSTYTLSADPGSFTLTGTNAILAVSRMLTAGVGAFTLNGQPVSFKASRVLSASPGSLTFSGTNAGLFVNYVLQAAAGAFSFTGLDATLTYSPVSGYTLVASPGTFTMSGTDASLLVSRVLTAESKVFSFTGTDVGLIAGFVLSAAPGTLNLSGLDANLRRGYTLAANSGSLSLAGQNAGLVISRVLSSLPGSFSLNGQPVTFLYSGIMTPESRIYVVPIENRLYAILADDRIYPIDGEDRTFTIEE